LLAHVSAPLLLWRRPVAAQVEQPNPSSEKAETDWAAAPRQIPARMACSARYSRASWSTG